MVKLRIKFKREEELRYLSHLDQHRMFSRALRRAQLPISFSHGFNPHPILSFANALSVGMTSDSEYMDIGLDIEDETLLNLRQIHKKLQAVLPKGIKLLEIRQIPDGANSLTKIIEYADYNVICQDLHVTDIDSLRQELDNFNSREKIEVETVNKKGKKKIRDIRPAFDLLEVDKDGKNVVFRIRILPVDNSLFSPEKVIMTFLQQINYYGNKINMISHRKLLSLNEDL